MTKRQLVATEVIRGTKVLYWFVFEDRSYTPYWAHRASDDSCLGGGDTLAKAKRSAREHLG